MYVQFFGTSTKFISRLHLSTRYTDGSGFLDSIDTMVLSPSYYCCGKALKPVANLIKHITIVNYNAKVVLTTNLPILRP